MPATVTLNQLRRLRACPGQLALFKQLFGEAVTVTEELCLQHAHEFDWSWAARHLLPASAFAEYDRALASARVEYNRALAPADAEYDRATAPARAEWDRATASARAERERATASAFARLYLAQE